MIRVLPFLNNLKDLDPSYKMDLDLWDSFGRKKNVSYIRGNTVIGRSIMQLMVTNNEVNMGEIPVC